jgi:predicted signal transduction protein with EAL and GGDEF domain
LVRAGEIMTRIGRKSDVLCRYDGDAFCMLMPNTDLQGALACAERFREAIAAEKQFYAKAVSFPTVSIGVATRTENMVNPEEMLEKADEALTWAKQNGRNCVAAYDASQSAIVQFRTKARSKSGPGLNDELTKKSGCVGVSRRKVANERVVRGKT